MIVKLYTVRCDGCLTLYTGALGVSTTSPAGVRAAVAEYSGWGRGDFQGPTGRSADLCPDCLRTPSLVGWIRRLRDVAASSRGPAADLLRNAAGALVAARYRLDTDKRLILVRYRKMLYGLHNEGAGYTVAADRALTKIIREMEGRHDG